MKNYVWCKRSKSRIQHVYYENGVRKVELTNCKPLLYTRDDLGEHVGLYGEKLKKYEFGSIKEAKDFIFDKNGSMMDIYGDLEFEYHFLHDHYLDKELKNVATIMFYDIEVIGDSFPFPYLAETPITSIAFRTNKSDEIYVYGYGDYDKNKTILEINPKNIKWFKFTNEEDLLNNFIKKIRDLNVDILTGWYSNGFDTPYVMNRILKVLGQEKLNDLSPFKKSTFSFKEEVKDGKIKMKYNCVVDGLTLIDMMDLYRKFNPGGEKSNKLNDVAIEVLGQTKIQYEDEETLMELFKQDYQKFIDYNIWDTQLLYLINENTGILNLLQEITYMMLANFDDAMGTVKLWDVHLYHLLRSKGIQIPPLRKEEKHRYAGGFVYPPTPDIYGWSVSFDYDSLYPNCILQYNVSPETLIDGYTVDVDQKNIDPKFINMEIDVDQRYILACNGQYFKKELGFIPKRVLEIYNERKECKKKKLELEREYEVTKDETLKNNISIYGVREKALKVLLNSLYGAMGSNAFRYYDTRLASAITLSGQYAINMVIKNIKEYVSKYGENNKIIFGDTDSCGVTIPDIVDKFLKKKPDSNDDDIVSFIDRFAKQNLQVVIDKTTDDISKFLNTDINAMKMKREKIMSKFLITGKKRYACIVHDNEGVRYSTPKMSVTGIEVVRSTTPKKIRAWLKEALYILVTDKDKIPEYLNKVKKEFMELPIEDISYTVGLSNVEKWIDKNDQIIKGIPIYVRAAWSYNDYLKKNKIVSIKPISSGDRIKYVYMNLPNPSHQNVFGFPNRIPEEYKRFVDKKLQYDKTFLKVIQAIAEKVNINIDSNNITYNSFNDLF